MAAPKIFLSSTCYDLNVLRGELRTFIAGLGYEPFMSEFSDLLFDPRQHTHTSCVQEVGSCDMLIVIVGKRFGGTGLPDTAAMLDYEKLAALSRGKDILGYKEKLSITQLEVLKAIELGVPVFSFVDAGVMNDHFTYERNKAKPILNEIEFPNIEKQDTAKYIFEFINFLRLRSSGNAIITFSRLEEIREHLRRQWAALFQRMLYEDRTRQQEVRRFDALSNQIAGLQTALLTSISSDELKETARGAIQFRHLIEFVLCFDRVGNPREALLENISWTELLKKLGIMEIRPMKDSRRPMFSRTVLMIKDGTHYVSRLPPRLINEGLPGRWEEFKNLKKKTKEAVLTAVIESRDGVMSPARHVNSEFKEEEEPIDRPDSEELRELQQNLARNTPPLSA